LNGLLGIFKHGAGPDGMIALVAGFLVAAISGAWAIRFLLSYVAKKRYDVFVVYRLALALVVWVVL
jgi:undecaprenyl pyrophosphate phosphatase UppP